MDRLGAVVPDGTKRRGSVARIAEEVLSSRGVDFASAVLARGWTNVTWLAGELVVRVAPSAGPADLLREAGLAAYLPVQVGYPDVIDAVFWTAMSGFLRDGFLARVFRMSGPHWTGINARVPSSKSGRRWSTSIGWTFPSRRHMSDPVPVLPRICDCSHGAFASARLGWAADRSPGGGLGRSIGPLLGGAPKDVKGAQPR